MSLSGLVEIGLFLVVLLTITKPLGAYMARVFSGERTFLSPALAPVEYLIYRLTGVDPSMEQRWTSYAVSMLLFSLAGAACRKGFEARKWTNCCASPQTWT